MYISAKIRALTGASAVSARSERMTLIHGIVLSVLVLSGCEIDGSDNLPRVPDQGLFMLAEVNRHEAEDEAQVATAVFNDGVPVNLTGGDVFEARTATERVLLMKPGPVEGSYAASLPVDNSVQDVSLNIVHEPVEARANRWYPIDLLNIDPGPGELVGKSATVSFPQPVTIEAPVADTEYTSITEQIDLQWIPGDDVDDDMRVLSAIECTDGLATSSYGTIVDKEAVPDLDFDDGNELISLDKFIYDLNQGSSTIKFLSDATLALMQELLNQLSAGNIDPDFLLKQRNANPIESTCEIRLFLQRQRQGQFDVAFDDGIVTGSTSSEVTILYIPPVSLD
jgi:hypothetical protein